MGFTPWIVENWFPLLQSVGIVASLCYTAQSFQLDIRARRVATHFDIVAHHRRIWSELYDRPELARIRDPAPDLERHPITIEEELFVTQVIHHLGAVYDSVREGVVHPFEGAEEDIQQFFSKPIPFSIWKQRQSLQWVAFVTFIEELLSESKSRHRGKP